MVICNACRYCEGFCAVFPAMERRRTFSENDLIYLANLCHDCRGCYYACQYAPPHEFDLNVPKTFQDLRMETYRDYSTPGVLANLFRRNGLVVTMVTTLMVALTVLAFFWQDPRAAFAVHLGEGAFYEAMPYLLVILPASLIALLGMGLLLKATLDFWRNTGGKLKRPVTFRALLRATADTLQLKYLGGGGHGCNYPGERFSQIRKWFHHLMFYGFMLCLAATTVAAIYEHFLDRMAPYPVWSVPVVLGTVGGVALLLGSGGLFWLKWRSDPAPARANLRGMDLALSMLLFLTSLSGLWLLAVRETEVMGISLAVHLGLVLSLFLMLPYGKFVHASYRYVALLQNAMEDS